MRVIVFNVYPYRDRFKKAKTVRVFSELGLGVSLALALAWGVSTDLTERLGKQASYKTELSRMEEEIASRVARVQAMKDEASNLRRQVDALEAVERDSLVASNVLSYLDAGLPKSVGLSKLNFANNVLLVQGLTESVPQLAKWVEDMEGNSSLFKSVDLVYLKDELNGKEPDGGPHQFEVRLVLQGAPLKTAAGEVLRVTNQ
jgi:Tfp pilus assembly protein PilN